MLPDCGLSCGFADQFWFDYNYMFCNKIYIFTLIFTHLSVVYMILAGIDVLNMFFSMKIKMICGGF